MLRLLGFLLCCVSLYLSPAYLAAQPQPLDNPFGALPEPVPANKKNGPAAPTPLGKATAAPAGVKTANPSILETLPIPDTMSWEMGLAENAYLLNKNVKNKARLVNIYEKVTGAICMPNLHRVLAYEGHPTFPKCLEFIEKTLKLDPANPIAICAREGIGSDICRAAFEQQPFQTFDPKAEEQSGRASLDDVLLSRQDEPARQKRISELHGIINSIQRTSPKARKPEQTAQLRQAFISLISIQCRTTRIKLDETDKELAQSDSSEQQGSLTEDEKLLLSMEKPTPTAPSSNTTESILLDALSPKSKIERAAKSLPKGKRIYQISFDCKSALDLSEPFDRKLAAAECARWGYYSPHCIDAKKREASLPTIERRPVRDNGGGIDTF